MKYHNLTKQQIKSCTMNSKISLIVLVFALFFINLSASKTTEEQSEDEDIFVATHEWQVIKEGKKSVWCMCMLMKNLPPVFRSENPKRLACPYEFANGAEGSKTAR